MTEQPTRAYVSCGAGVQSTAIALLCINRDERLLEATGGVLPELFIFADTGDEPQQLYRHIQALKHNLEHAGYPFFTVRSPLGDLSHHIAHAAKRGHKRAEQLPFFVFDEDKYKNGVVIKRHCTKEFKIKPLTQFARHWFGVYRGKVHDGSNVQMWLGLSSDEPQRLKHGRVPKQEWCEYTQPLHLMNWERADCINYLREQKWYDPIQCKFTPVPTMRSSCVFCPFHDKAEWRKVKSVPEDWARAIEVDEALEKAHKNGGAFGFENPLFLNPDGVRLRDLDLSEDEVDDEQNSLWDAECTGYCGI